MRQITQALPPFQLFCSSPRMCAAYDIMLTNDLPHLEIQSTHA